MGVLQKVFASAPLKAEYDAYSKTHGADAWPPITQLLAKHGAPMDSLSLKVLGIPESLHGFYSDRGVFAYKPDSPRVLALENGDQEFDVVRVHQGHNGFLPQNSIGIITDYFAAMDLIPDFKLRLLVGSQKVGMGGRDLTLPLVRERLKLQPAAKWDRVESILITPDRLIVWSKDDAKELRDGRALVPTAQAVGQILEDAYPAARKLLVQSGKMTEVISPFSFDGGDVLAGHKHVFVGYKTILDNARRLKISTSEVVAGLSAEFGQPVFLASLGSSPQQILVNLIYHADLIGIPARDRIVKDEVILLSSPNKTVDILKMGTDLSAVEKRVLAELTGNSKFIVDLWETANDRLRRDLKKEGYRVLDLPGAVFPIPPSAEDRRIGRQPVLTINYTNSELGGQFALVPSLDAPNLNREAHGTFTSLGYQVVPFPSAQEYFEYKGGIRCASNIKRKPL